MNDPIDNLTPDQHQLYELMSEISEDCYCAGWMHGNEFTLWSAIQTGEMRYGMSDIDRELLAQVAALSVKTGCWIVWRDDHNGPEYAHVDTWGPYAITLAEWGAIYDAKNDMRPERTTAPAIAPDGESWQHKCEETERALIYWKAKARALLAAAPSPAVALEPWAPSEEQFEQWRARHGLHHSHNEAFYDAASLYLEATPPALAGSQVQAAGDMLQPDDLKALQRFFECCEDFDSGGHDVGKERMARLRELGVIQSKGFGRDQITAFGDYVMCLATNTKARFPLKTFAEYNDDARLAHEAKLAAMREQP